MITLTLMAVDKGGGKNPYPPKVDKMYIFFLKSSLTILVSEAYFKSRPWYPPGRPRLGLGAPRHGAQDLEGEAIVCFSSAKPG